MYKFCSGHIDSSTAGLVNQNILVSIESSRDVVRYSDHSLKYADLPFGSALHQLYISHLHKQSNHLFEIIAPTATFYLRNMELHRYIPNEKSLSLHQDNYGWHIKQGIALSLLIYLGPLETCSPIAFYPLADDIEMLHAESDVSAYSSEISNPLKVYESKRSLPSYRIGDLSVHCHLTPHGPGKPVRSNNGAQFLRLVYFSQCVEQDHAMIELTRTRVLRNRLK